jgi:hypothetical protein
LRTAVVSHKTWRGGPLGIGAIEIAAVALAFTSLDLLEMPLRRRR